MACDISLGRAEFCKDSIGGLSAVYIMNFDDSQEFIFNSDGVLTDAGGGDSYKYELKGTSTFEQNITSSRENGSTFVDQKLTLNLKKLSITDHKQLKILSYGRPRIFIEDNNGNIFLAGLEKGMELVTSIISTGAAMGDVSGYKLEFIGTEIILAPFIAENSLSEIGISVTVGT